jgi:NADPH2:quinone reductase
MKAAWYEKPGPARDVLIVGEMPNPHPAPGEVRIRVAASGINPGDTKKRSDTFGLGLAFPRIIPHSDGAGIIDELGDGVSPDRLGQRVWCFGAQSYRPFGTAAEYTVVPAAQAVPLPGSVSFDQGACLGIPGITAHRAVHVAGPVRGRTVLIQGAAGSVGLCAVQLARQAGARVIGTIRSSREEQTARDAGAHEVVLNDADFLAHMKSIAPEGIDHIVEVAFAANIANDVELLRQGGSLGTYATDNATPTLPFWPMVFNNIQLNFLGSDDFPPEAKAAATRDLNAALESGWQGFLLGDRVPLDDIAHAHELAEHPTHPGRVVVTISP